MSFLTALLTGMSGFQQGRRDRQEQQYRDAEIKRQNAELGLEQQRADIEGQKWKEQQREILANRGVDPTTNKPFVMPAPLTQIRPNNMGKGGPATPQDLFNHYTSLARWYTQTGQTDAANMAASQAAEIQKQMDAQRSQEAVFNRELFLAGLRASTPPKPTWLNEYDLQHGIVPGQPQEPWIDRYDQAHGLPPGYNPNAANKGQVTRLSQLASKLDNDYKQLWSNLTFIPKGPMAGIAPLDPATGKPIAAKLSPTAQSQVQEVQVALDYSDAPKKDAAAYLKRLKNPDPNIVKLVQKYADYRQVKVEAEKALEQESSGGSYGTPPFPGP